MNQAIVPILKNGVIYGAIFLIIIGVIFRKKKIEDTRNALIAVYYFTGFYILTLIKHYAMLQYRLKAISSFTIDNLIFSSMLIILSIIALMLRNRRNAPFWIIAIQAIFLIIYQITLFKGPTNLLWDCILLCFSSGITLSWRVFFLSNRVFLATGARKEIIVRWTSLTGELFSFAITVLIALAATMGVALTILYNRTLNTFEGGNCIEVVSESVIFIIGYCWVAFGFIIFIGLPYLHNRKALMYLPDGYNQSDSYVQKYTRQLDREESVYEGN